MPFTVAICKPLSRTKETTAILKKVGETFTLRCPSHPCTAATETDVDTYNFTKITTRSEFIHQGRVFRKVISDVNDTATYCCVPSCAKDAEPCCVNVKCTYMHNTYTNTSTSLTYIIVIKDIF